MPVTSQGPNNGSAFINTGFGSTWGFPEDAQFSDDLYASIAILASGLSSAVLEATGFDFHIPTDAQVRGILVEIERKSNTASAADDISIQLLSAGAGVGSSKTGSTWPTSDAYQSYGGSNDMWGRSWTASEINAADFGVGMKTINNSAGTISLSVDHMCITVYYEPHDFAVVFKHA